MEFVFATEQRFGYRDPFDSSWRQCVIRTTKKKKKNRDGDCDGEASVVVEEWI